MRPRYGTVDDRAAARPAGSIRRVVTPANPSSALAPSLPLRARLAVGVGRVVAGASRLTHIGSGSVIGGRASLLVEPRLLERTSAGREVVLVSATNGKTTTTRFLTAALADDRPVVSNWLGANMTPGLVAALGAADRRQTTAVLEVDERWIEQVLSATRAATVVLLNLSRDQLDRTQEVRDLAAQWRRALERHRPATVVANADDPLVAWAAMAAPSVRWVATGRRWVADATGCPACGGRIAFDDVAWHCESCALRRPTPDAIVDDDTVVLDGAPIPLALALPGRINAVNAAFALTAAAALGVDPRRAAVALGSVREVAGRYRTAAVAGTDVRLLLAKNPAGWAEALELLDHGSTPMVAAINARIADGHDPSWLWDVEFERLSRRFVVAIGERRHDLAVRLRYAGVDHTIADDLPSALAIVGRTTGHDPAQPVDVASNYTAFQDHLALVGGTR